MTAKEFEKLLTAFLKRALLGGNNDRKKKPTT